MCRLSSSFSRQFARQFSYDQLYVGNPCRVLSHRDSLVDSVSAWSHFIIVPIGTSFPLSIKDPQLLTSLTFCLWYLESNNIELESNLYYIGLVCIHKHYSKLATKTSMVVRLKEYMKNLPNLRHLEGLVLP